MNKESFNSKSGSARRHDAGTHPVLARLPDVTGQPLMPPRSARAAAAGFVDYRFDMPAGVEEAEMGSRQRVQPPAFKRSPRSEHGSQPFGGASRALPGSNPFALPATSLLDRFVPVARFLVMFLLFTAVGTFVLSTTRERTSDPDRIQPPSAAAPSGVEQTLEPTSNADYPTVATPKAIGPLGAISNKAVFESSRSVEIEPQIAPGNPKSTAELVPSLSGANVESLPQLQTTEITPAPDGIGGDLAPARLTGSIRSSDDSPAEERTKPPAVARLPAIFEAPRQAQLPLPALGRGQGRGYQ